MRTRLCFLHKIQSIKSAKKHFFFLNVHTSSSPALAEIFPEFIFNAKTKVKEKTHFLKISLPLYVNQCLFLPKIMSVLYDCMS